MSSGFPEEYDYMHRGELSIGDDVSKQPTKEIEKSTKGLGRTVSRKIIPGSQAKKVGEVSSNVRKATRDLKDKDDSIKLVGKKILRLGELLNSLNAQKNDPTKLSRLQENYEKLGDGFLELARHDPNDQRVDETRERLENDCDSLLLDCSSQAEKVSLVYSNVNNAISKLGNQTTDDIRRIADDMQSIETALLNIRSEMRGKEGLYPELENEFSRLQEKFVQLGSDFVRCQRGVTMDIKQLESEVKDGLKSFQRLEEAFRNIEHTKKILRNSPANTPNEKKLAELTDAVVKTYEIPGRNFEDVIGEVMKKTETSFKDEWSLAEKSGDISTLHHEQFVHDVDRPGVVIDGEIYDAQTVEDVSGDVKPELLRQTSEALINTMNRSTTVGKFNENRKQLLRYEIESFFNQTAATFSNKMLESLYESYFGLNLFPGNCPMDESDRKAGSYPVECNFVEPNTLVITRNDLFEVKGMDKVVKGYDAIKTTITIDLSKVTEDKLLESEGAVSVQSMKHGFREKREEIRF